MTEALKDRLRTAAIAIPIILLLIFGGGVFGIALMVTLAAVVGTDEFLNLAGHGGDGTERLLLKLWGGVIASSFICPSPAMPAAMLALGVIGFVMAEALGKGNSPELIAKASRVGMAWLMVPYFLGHAVLVGRFGATALIYLMIVVMIGDTAAYFVGSKFGKRRLAPTISPKKSIEGSLGGLAGSVICGLAFMPLLPEGITAMQALVIAVMLNIAGQVGDLVESALKRSAGVKDSGDLLPGHGGVLDRLDSFIPTAPIFAAILMSLAG